MQKFKAPLLPLPPKEYEQSYLVQLIRTLGLYFGQMDSTTPVISDSAQFTNIPTSTEYANLINGSLYKAVGSDIVRVKTEGVAFSSSAGTTAARPSTNLQVGQQYFDTTLGIPIWWGGISWVNATGTPV